MADVNIALKLHPLSLREFERKVKQALIKNVEGLVESYLATLPDKTRRDRESYYLTRAELERFVDWVKSRVGEPDAPGPAVH